MSRDDLTYISHMLDAAGKAIEFSDGRARADLDGDELLALALVRLLEILGEASRNVTQETKASCPEIPWQQIAATRNRLIHGYFDVDLDIVWSIISIDLPQLVESLGRIQGQLSADFSD